VCARFVFFLGANFLTEKSGESNITKNFFLGNNVSHYEEHNAELAIFRLQVPNYTKNFFVGRGGGLGKWATLDLAKFGYKLDMKVKKCKNFVIFWLFSGTYCRNLAFYFFFFFPFGNLAN
jgi:hypothetical protein